MAEADALRVIDKCASLVAAHSGELADWAANYARHHRHRLADDLRMIRQTVDHSQRLLELGSLPLFLTLALTRDGYDVVGLDIAPDRFSEVVAAHGLDIRAVNFETHRIPLERASVDVVLCNEVFEHLRIDLIATMREVHRVLKVGGVMMLSSPNMRSLRGLWMLFRHGTSCHIGPDLFDEYDKLRRFGHMGHVREYTATEVSRFLRRIGFSIDRVVYRDYGPPVRRSVPVRALAAFENAVCLLAPSLKSFFTIVCTKKADDPTPPIEPAGMQ